MCDGRMGRGCRSVPVEKQIEGAKGDNVELEDEGLETAIYGGGRHGVYATWGIQ